MPRPFNTQVDENGYLIVPLDKTWPQLIADVNQKPFLGKNPHQIEGAPAYADLQKQLWSSGHLKGRESTTTSDFCFYLMGEKGMSVQEISDFLTEVNDPDRPAGGELTQNEKLYRQYLKDFWKFVKDNPISPDEDHPEQVLTPKKRQESSKNWTDMYEKCIKKFKEYKFPDIDYTNPQEVAKHGQELYLVATILQDYQQELEQFLGRCPADTRKAVGSYGKVYREGVAWRSLNGFAGLFLKSYTVKNNKFRTALARVMMKDYSPVVRGKTVEETTKDALRNVNMGQVVLSADGVLSSRMMEQPELNTQNVNNVIKGQNVPEFENFVLQYCHDNTDTNRKLLNQTLSAQANSYFYVNRLDNPSYKKEIRDAVDELFAGNPEPDAAEIHKRLTEDKNGERFNTINDAFHVFDTEASDTIREKLGVEFMDTIRIDGYSPAELWGEKYANVKDPIEKQVLYQAEILKEIYHGNKEISVDVIMMDKDYKPVVYQCPIALSPVLVRRGYDLLDNVTAIHKDLEGDIRKLRDVDNKVREQEKNLYTAKPEYDQMVTSLMKAYNASGKNGRFDDLVVALKEYDNACKAYTRRVAQIKEQQNAQPEAQQGAVRSKELKKADEVNLAVAQGRSAGFDDVISDLKAETNRLGLMYGEDDMHINATFREYKLFRERLDREVTMRSFDPKDFTAESRKGMYHAEDYKWTEDRIETDPKSGKQVTVETWERSLGAQNYKFAEKDLNLNFSDDLADSFNDYGLKLMPKEEKINKKGEKITYNPHYPLYASIGFNKSRPDSQLGVYCLWLMGQKGYSIEQVSRMVFEPQIGADGKVKDPELIRAGEAHMEEFFQFCKDHPLTDSSSYKGEDYEINIKADKTENYANDVKAWTDMLSNATKKMKEYRIPNIDYTDAHQLRRFRQEFFLIRSLGINFGQEVPKLFAHNHPVKSTYEFACEQLGGEGKYYELIQDWLSFQAITNGLSMSYFTPHPVQPDSSMRNVMKDLTQTALYSVAQDEEFKPYKGKTLGEAIDDWGGKGIGMFDRLPKIVASRIPTGEQRYDLNPSIGLVSGRDRKAITAFRKEYKKERQLFNKDAEGLLKTSVASLLNFRFFGDLEWLQGALKEMGDNPNDMLNLLNGKARKTENKAPGQPEFKEDSETVRTFLYNKFRSTECLNADYRAILGKKNMSMNELFLIDGQTSEERWGAKYQGFNETDKKACYMGEIAKVIFTQNAKLQLRGYKFEQNGEINEAEPYTVLEKKEEMNKNIDAASEMMLTTSELKSELESLQEEFSATQDKKNANRYLGEKAGGPKDVREGTDLYQNMTVKLDQCIQDLDEESGATQEEIKTHLDELIQASDTYYAARFGRFFRPVQDYGKKRLTASDKTRTLVRTFRERMDKIGLELSGEMFASDFTKEAEQNRETVKNAPMEELENFIRRANYRTGKAQLTEQETKSLYVNTFKDELLQKVQHQQAPDANDEKKQLAHVYLQYSTPQIFENGRADIRDVRRLDRYNEEVDRLSGNPLFIRYMRANATKCIRDWNEIEKRAMAEEERAEAGLKNLKKFGTYSEHVARPLMGPRVPKGAEQILARREENAKEIRNITKKVGDLYINPKERREAYKRLTETVILQILNENSPTAQRVLLSIGADQLAHERNPQVKADKTMKQMSKSIYKYLEEQKALEGENAMKTLIKLDNGLLVKELKTHLETQHKTEMARNNNQANLGIQVADPVAEVNQNQMNGPGMGH